MSSLDEIEAAISSLSPEDQAKLVRDLPGLIPEWEGDLLWQRILCSPKRNAALSALADAVDAEFERNPEAFGKITDGDFERNA